MAVTKLGWFNRLIPEVYRADSTRRTQASILLAILIFNNLYCVLSLLFLEYGLPEMSASMMNTGRFLILMGMTIYLAAFASYYLFSALAVSAHLVCFGLYASSVSSLFVTGGYMGSPLAVLVVLAPAFAFLLMGLRQGIIWSGLAMGTLLLLWILEQKLILEPSQLLTHPVVKRNLTLAVPMTVGAMVIAVMIIYEVITERLREELKEEKDKFKWDASHDALTGLPNRPEFFHRLQLGMRNAEVNQQSLALVYVDLDGFKPVNDELGHHAGDEVLKVVSRRLQSILRGSDSLARLGGDEFAIILQGVSTNREMMDGILAKALHAISEKMIIDGKEISVGASMGVVYYDKDESDMTALCRKADIAMYKAKENKNTWSYYSAAGG
jgi:diguanylate cyclase (GGDEF)-like protein